MTLCTNPDLIIEQYQKCINEIDDYLEYNYKNDSIIDIKKNITNSINKLALNLSIIKSCTTYKV